MSLPPRGPGDGRELGAFEESRLRMARCAVAGGLGLRAALRQTIELAAEALRVERCGVWLLVEQGSAIRCYDVFEQSSRAHAEGVILRAQDFPAYFRALRRRSVIAAQDARRQAETCELCEAYLVPLGIGSMLDAPIYRCGEVVGVVCHEHVGAPRAFSPLECEFACAVADAVALKMESAARLEAEATLREREARLMELSELRGMSVVAAGVAHDFRNVLTGIMNIAAVFARDVRIPANRSDDAKTLCALAEHGTSLARDLMTLAIESPRAPRVLDAAEFVASCLPILSSALRGTPCELRLARVAERALVLADATELRRVLLNLVSNARDATSETGGTVELRVERVQVGDPPAPFVALVVSDTGPGMDEATLARVGEPFFTTKAPGKGWGLGLAIVRSLAERAGGFLRIESEPGRGTTMRVYVPQVAGSAVHLH